MKRLFGLVAIIAVISICNVCAMKRPEGAKSKKLTQEDLDRRLWEERYEASRQADLKRQQKRMERERRGQIHPIARRNLTSEFDSAIGREDFPEYQPTAAPVDREDVGK